MTKPAKLLYQSGRKLPAARSGVAVQSHAVGAGLGAHPFRRPSPRRSRVGWTGDARPYARAVPRAAARPASAVSWESASHRVGPRADVFGAYPHAIYLPARDTVPDRCDRQRGSRRRPRAFDAGLPPRVIRPEDCGFEIRGGGNATRQIVDILPPAFPADRLMVCEVFTPGGNWSSYPPHKHDTDNPPREVELEEIYYYRSAIRTGTGFSGSNSRRDDTLRVTTATSSRSATDITRL